MVLSDLSGLALLKANEHMKIWGDGKDIRTPDTLRCLADVFLAFHTAAMDVEGALTEYGCPASDPSRVNIRRWILTEPHPTWSEPVKQAAREMWGAVLPTGREMETLQRLFDAGKDSIISGQEKAASAAEDRREAQWCGVRMPFNEARAQQQEAQERRARFESLRTSIAL